MTTKSGSVTGLTNTIQDDNTIDISVTVSYLDTTFESKKVVDNVLRITSSRAKPIVVPLNSTSPVLAIDPDTEFATGYVRSTVLRFV
jgi:quinolinate synthase